MENTLTNCTFLKKYFPWKLINRFLFKYDDKFQIKRDILMKMHGESDMRLWETSILDENSNSFYNHFPFKVGPIYTTFLEKASISFSEGTIYREKKSTEPKLKELIISFDVRDYDHLRSCKCAGTRNYCTYCWQTFARYVLETLLYYLTSVFQFKLESIFIFYSGDGGCYIWVKDENAMRLSNLGRETFCQFVTRSEVTEIPDIYNPNDNGITREWENYFKMLLDTNPVFSKKVDDSANKEVIMKKIEKGEISLPEMIYKLLPIKIDVKLTSDIENFITIPFTINEKTGKLISFIAQHHIGCFFPEDSCGIWCSLDPKDKDFERRLEKNLNDFKNQLDLFVDDVK